MGKNVHYSGKIVNDTDTEFSFHAWNPDSSHDSFIHILGHGGETITIPKKKSFAFDIHVYYSKDIVVFPPGDEAVPGHFDVSPNGIPNGGGTIILTTYSDTKATLKIGRRGSIPITVQNPETLRFLENNFSSPDYNFEVFVQTNDGLKQIGNKEEIEPGSEIVWKLSQD